MTFGVTILEALISWKFRHNAGNLVDAHWPNYVVIPWSVVIGTCLLYYFYLRFKTGHTQMFKAIPEKIPTDKKLK